MPSKFLAWSQVLLALPFNSLSFEPLGFFWGPEVPHVPLRAVTRMALSAWNALLCTTATWNLTILSCLDLNIAFSQEIFYTHSLDNSSVSILIELIKSTCTCKANEIFIHKELFNDHFLPLCLHSPCEALRLLCLALYARCLTFSRHRENGCRLTTLW